MKKKPMLIALCVVFALVFVGAGVKLVGEMVIRSKDVAVYEELAEQVSQAKAEIAQSATDEDGETVSPYAEIYAQNSDMIGWLTIPDTVVNYPVMHTPDNPEYYLSRDFNKSYSFSGTPFMEDTCCLAPESANLILYGHHMNNGTMFASLLDYRNAAYLEAHRLIYFEVLGESRTYEVTYGFYQEVLGETWTQGYYAYQTQEDFDVFRDHCVTEDTIHSGGDIAYDDQLLTLFTCSSLGDDIRFVIVAKRIA